jgi:hypothetical protein
MNGIVGRLLSYRPIYGFPEEHMATIKAPITVEAAQYIAKLEGDLSDACDIMGYVLEDHLQDLSTESMERLRLFLDARGRLEG